MNQHGNEDQETRDKAYYPVLIPRPIREFLGEVCRGQNPGEENQNQKPAGIDMDVDACDLPDSPGMPHFMCFAP
jgi:hypothetical protein